jgi:hypothetical protein
MVLSFLTERLVELPGNELGRSLASRIRQRIPVMPRVA